VPVDIRLPWIGVPQIKKKKTVNKNKVKYVCPTCGAQVWGKPDLNVLCGDCSEELEPDSE